VSFPFDGTWGLILVTVRLEGPNGDLEQIFALDTGATNTSISAEAAETLGYDIQNDARNVSMTTGSGVETVPMITLTKLSALGREWQNLPVTAHTLPPSAHVDGVLGLDFFRRMRLTIDFYAEQITLESGIARSGNG
jgi:predicted aspartyl protease